MTTKTDIPDYRHILRDLMLEKKDKVSKSYTFQNLATACRVQKTYLTRVFKDEAHLSEDQLYLACDFLGFDPKDYLWITKLHAYERSACDKRRTMLRHEIYQLMKKQQQSDAYLAAKSLNINQELLNQYYLNPDMQLVHMFLTIEHYASDVAAIADHLGLTTEKVLDLIRHLEQTGIISFEKGKYHVRESQLHLNQDSPLYVPYRMMLKMRGIEQQRKLGADDLYNFNVIFSANEKTKNKIKQRFLEFLRSVEPDVVAAPAEDVFQMSFDLFKWS